MIAANRGAVAGWLVPLSAGLCYIGKPGRFLPSSSISKVLFHRTGAGSSTFDITIQPVRSAAGGAASAAAADKPFELGQIDAAELVKLQLYLQQHCIRIGADGDDDDDAQDNAVQGAVAAAAAAPVGDDSDEDEDDDDFDPEAVSGWQLTCVSPAAWRLQ
eukprot:GHRQ01035503.1.p2 GENE.GHRQ01035503.1~~GHRQ01035503.1.p2  ORF type:complete len:160 (+),score=73.26 GHRQ01035503.1:121-600(+)